MAGLQELVRQAKELRVPSSLIRANMGDATKLATVIESFQTGKAHHNQEVKRMPVAKAKAKAKVTKRAPVKRTTAVKAVKRGPGRPKGSTNKPKPATTARKQRASRRPRGARLAPRMPGRNMIGRISFTNYDNWNPRDGSVTSIIFKSLKKHKGDRDKTFNELKSSIRSLIPGTYTKQARETALRYRISRTLWDFAVQTGQHDKSENRAQYGTAGTGNGTKSKPKRKAAVKATVKPAKGKRGPGRPPGSKNKPKPVQARTTTRKVTRRKSTSRR